MLFLQLLVVLVAIIIGARLGGIGLGVMGGVGLAILSFVFGLQPTAPPIDVMLMIAAVIAAASCMQAAGGLEYMVKVAEHILRRNPAKVTILSPISAATVALLGLLAGFDISLFDILKVTVPATLIGVLVGAFCSMKVGKELEDDPEYQRRLKEGMIEEVTQESTRIENLSKARISVLIFLFATFLIVLFGSIDSLRPSFEVNGQVTMLNMPSIIEIIMLSTAAVILLVCRIDGIKAVQGNIFPAGMQAVIAIFGIAWMGDTFIAGNLEQLKGSIEQVVQSMPWLFGVALFVMSILLYSQAATIRAVVPLGIALGISPLLLIALFPAVNGYFFIPNYPTVVAAINFDRTGTTRIGKYILNHSFMMPGLVSTIVAILVGLLLIQVLF